MFGFRLGVFGLVSSSVLRVASGLTVFSGLSAIFELLILWVLAWCESCWLFERLLCGVGGGYLLEC
ncbi:MAG: hypothetical protein QXI15_08140, partial [Zestosphaera sp.]